MPTLTNDLARLANSANVLVSAITVNSSAITSVNVGGLTINSSGIAGDLSISGNLVVTGTTVTVNTTTIDVKDLNITLAKGAGSNSSSNGAGITVESPNAQFYYSSSANSWQSTHSFIVGGGAQSTRPTGSNGMIRYNTNTGMTEIYSATGWGTVQVSSIDYGSITDSVITSLDFGGV